MDASFAGRTFPPTEPYHVSREKIREFADAIGAPEAAYHAVDAAVALGYPDVIAPPTFAVLISQWASDSILTNPALGLDWSRVVHADQRFAYTRPVQAGDRLAATVTIEEIMSRAGNGFISLRVDLAHEDQLVVTVWSRLVERGA